MMGDLAALALHLALTLACGAALLAACGAAVWPALPAEAFILGVFAETTLAGAMLALGLPLPTALGVTWSAALAGLAWALWKRRADLRPPRPPRLAWHEWLLFAVAAEKLAGVGRTLAASPIIFDDALTAWAGRARALFGGANFSWEPTSTVFLGFAGPCDYPLSGPLWNAGSALLAEGWSDLLARADGALAWFALAGLLWAAVRRSTDSRLAGSLAGLAALLLPFPFWHALAGYADLPSGAAATACLALLCRGAYLPAGLAAAAAVWTKNDALYVFAPALLLACLLRLFPLRDLMLLRLADPARATSLGLFLGGMAACAPWLAFRLRFVEGVALSLPLLAGLACGAALLATGAVALRRSSSSLAIRLRRILASAGLPLLAAAGALALGPAVAHRLGATTLSWHPDAPGLFLKVLVQSTHAVLWPFVAALLLAGSLRLARDPMGRAALAGLLVPLAAVFFIFSCTPAFEYLLLETTVHRSLLQLYGPALLAGFLGMAPAHTKTPAPSPGPAS